MLSAQRALQNDDLSETEVEAQADGLSVFFSVPLLSQGCSVGRAIATVKKIGIVLLSNCAACVFFYLLRLRFVRVVC